VQDESGFGGDAEHGGIMAEASRLGCNEMESQPVELRSCWNYQPFGC
jgi:hypothetical protein